MTSFLIEKDSGLKRDQVINKHKKLNIDSRPVFPSISQYPIWGKKYDENTNSKLISENALNLPSGVKLTYNEIDYISDALISMVR